MKSDTVSLSDSKIHPPVGCSSDSKIQQIRAECVAPFSRLFLMGSFSYLQVMMTYIRAWMSLKFG